MTQLTISKSVGDVMPDGSPSPNMYQDTLIVQYLLNNAIGPGRPATPLPLDGACTPQLINAIRNYEAYLGFVDGRIDPGDFVMMALNVTNLARFEGVTDPLEQRSIILRKNPQWNFTRGDFQTLTQFAGTSLRFSADSGWLPDALKQRYLAIFNALLSPARDPAPTWGVGPLDWYHSHLGFWSGQPHVAVSPAAQAWTLAAANLRRSIDALRAPYLRSGAMPLESIAAYNAAYRARLAQLDVAALLNTYAAFPEAMIIHHSFEDVNWRPQMDSDDERRHWMVDPAGNLHTPDYRTPEALGAAQGRNEFICEGSIQINFLIDQSATIHPVLGNFLDLCTVTGIDSDSMFYP